jgi:hypothetical protein
METQHTGSCHCGEIKFTARVDLGKATRCNCSVCTKLSVIGCITKPENLEVTAGDPAFYEWGGKTAKRYFCRTCGTHCFGRGYLEQVGGAYAYVNLNTLDDIDPFQLTTIHWDGRHDNWMAGPRPTPWPIFPAA